MTGLPTTQLRSPGSAADPAEAIDAEGPRGPSPEHDLADQFPHAGWHREGNRPRSPADPGRTTDDRQTRTARELTATEIGACLPRPGAPAAAPTTRTTPEPVH
jgi:hypothetical protein